MTAAFNDTWAVAWDLLCQGQGCNIGGAVCIGSPERSFCLPVLMRLLLFFLYPACCSAVYCFVFFFFSSLSSSFFFFFLFFFLFFFFFCPFPSCRRLLSRLILNLHETNWKIITPGRFR